MVLDSSPTVKPKLVKNASLVAPCATIFSLVKPETNETHLLVSNTERVPPTTSIKISELSPVEDIEYLLVSVDAKLDKFISTSNPNIADAK